MSELKKSKDTETGSLVHILGLLVGFIGPLLFYFGSDDEFVKSNAATATNWQLSVTVYTVFLSFITGFSTGFVSMLFLANFYFSAVAAKKASNGKLWEYPLSMSLVGDTNKEFEDDSEYESTSSYNSRVERVKNLYYKGIIDEDEMERRIEDSLKDNDNTRSNNYDKSRNLEYSKN